MFPRVLNGVWGYFCSLINERLDFCFVEIIFQISNMGIQNTDPIWTEKWVSGARNIGYRFIFQIATHYLDGRFNGIYQANFYISQ